MGEYQNQYSNVECEHLNRRPVPLGKALSKMRHWFLLNVWGHFRSSESCKISNSTYFEDQK